MKIQNTTIKAYWTQRTHLFRSDEYICSACGYSADKPYRQCPSCRSDMYKSKYDPSWVDEAEIMDIFRKHRGTVLDEY